MQQGAGDDFLELGGKQRGDVLRVGDEVAVGDQAELHRVVVAEDGHADADVARLRHPEHHLVQQLARQVQRLGGAGHVGHHRAGLAGQHVQEGLLQGLGQQAGGAQQHQGQRRLVTAAQLQHALAQQLQPGEGVGFVQRQQQRDQAEAVAQPALVVTAAQVDRHHRTQLHLFQRVAAAGQVLAQGTGHRVEQQVVDRAAQRLADGLHLGQWNRLAPGHPFVAAGAALEPGGAVRRHRQQPGQLIGKTGGMPAQRHQPVRLGQRHLGLLPETFTQPHGCVGGLGERVEQRGPGVGVPVRRRVGGAPGVGVCVCVCVFARLIEFRRRVQHIGRCVGTQVGERQHHPHQRDAVGDAVVDARDHRSAPIAVFDQVEAPERALGVQLLGGQFAHQVLQLPRPGGRGQGAAHEVVVEVELRVVFPPPAGPVVDHPLAEAPETLHQPALQGCTQSRGVYRFVQMQDADNHHQVGRPVHPQPGGVDR